MFFFVLFKLTLIENMCERENKNEEREKSRLLYVKEKEKKKNRNQIGWVERRNVNYVGEDNNCSIIK